MSTNINTNYETINSYNNSSNGQGNVPREVSVFNKLATLCDDGDNGAQISVGDLSKSRELIGYMGISNVRRDANKGIINIFFEDGSKMHYNIQTATERAAKENLTKDIEAGNATTTRSLNPLKGFKKYIQVNVPKGTPIKELMEKYNLPAEAFYDYVTYGLRDTNKPVEEYCTDTDICWFDFSDYVEATDLTADEVNKMFKQD